MSPASGEKRKAITLEMKLEIVIAQLQAVVSVLSMFKEGFGIMFGMLGVLNAFSTGDIFNL